MVSAGPLARGWQAGVPSSGSASPRFRQLSVRSLPRSNGGWWQFGGCFHSPFTNSIGLSRGPARCAVRSERPKQPRMSLRAAVGSTEARNGRLARVGVVGPTRARRNLALEREDPLPVVLRADHDPAAPRGFPPEFRVNVPTLESSP